MRRVGSIIDGCDVGITAASALRPTVGLGVVVGQQKIDKRAWVFLTPQDALDVSAALREYALEGMKFISTEGGDSSMADIIQPVAPHDPGAGTAERNLPHVSPDDPKAEPTHIGTLVPNPEGGPGATTLIPPGTDTSPPQTNPPTE